MSGGKHTPEGCLDAIERDVIRYRKLVDGSPTLVQYARVLLDVVSDAQWSQQQHAKGVAAPPCEWLNRAVEDANPNDEPESWIDDYRRNRGMFA